MPLPLFLGIGAAILGAAGVGGAIDGAEKMKKANARVEEAQERHKRNINRFEKQSRSTTVCMDKLGKHELEILQSFSEFADVFERIKNRPVFKSYAKNGVKLPQYNGEKLKEVSVGANVVLGGLTGAGLGYAGGCAAAGATSAVVMAVGTASTGTAIASLSGAAATNATLAALGGGSIAAGGGGMALGATVLGGATLGVGLLVGGIIFSMTGDKVSAQADEAWEQMEEAEAKIDKICEYLSSLEEVSTNYNYLLSVVDYIYRRHLGRLKETVIELKRTDWNSFTKDEKLVTENTVLLVNLLFNMCKVELVLKGKGEDDMNSINWAALIESETDAKTLIEDRFPEFAE